ncbi:toxin [Mycobacterium angelicum]|uniref:Toxin n=1 Tax=Mycobacterium angelicum TaxID=470074 RepID=A0A1W9ZLH4_MYCAN|nr:toxin [Mycobacterium angelicum]MCV7196437.1 toxin [Mycobacterium angelicum]ORA17629.1 toxin [Mycobacterium angelicum]
MIAPGAIAARRDSNGQLYVVVLSNTIHLAAATGRIITCPFIPGQIPDDIMAMVVTVDQPPGTLLPELVQWLPSSALDEPIGTIGKAALRETTSIVTALISS